MTDHAEIDEIEKGRRLRGWVYLIAGAAFAILTLGVYFAFDAARDADDRVTEVVEGSQKRDVRIENLELALEAQRAQFEACKDKKATAPGCKEPVAPEPADVGPQGIPGLQGPQGIQGFQGPKGDTGEIGPQGPKGQRGIIGPIGPKGDTGDIGSEGTPGDSGTKGDPGADGKSGEIGPKGPQGDRGEQGERGPEGPTGPAGPQGETGTTGLQGEVGPQGSTGILSVAVSPGCTDILPNKTLTLQYSDGVLTLVCN